MAGSLTEVREALSEIEQYLTDTLPPLLVAGSLRFLIERSTDVFAAHLVEWAQEHAPKNEREQVEWLANALRRFSKLAELRVIPDEVLCQLMQGLQPALLGASPPHYRDGLQLAFYQVLHPVSRKDVYAVSKEMQLDDVTVQSSERLARNLLPLIDKLAAGMAQSKAGNKPQVTEEMVTQLLAAATRTAESSQQLNERLERLKALGLDTDVPAVLRALGRSLPNWAVVPPAPPGPSSGPGPSQKLVPAPRFRDNRLKAMQRIVELSEQPEENSKRFSHMVRTAIEQFNQGALGRAVAIVDSARQLVNEGKVAPPVGNPIWAAAEEEIRLGKLAEYAADAFSHDLLQRFIGFFQGLEPLSLLTQLKTGSTRFPRRLLLSLLQVGGNETRRVLLYDLSQIVEEEIPESSSTWDYVRDAMSLLAALAIPDMSPDDDELDIVARLTGSSAPLPAFRELVRYFEFVKSERACAVLTTLLRQAKNRAERASGDPDGTVEAAWILLVDRILTRLAVYDHAPTRHTVLDHCIGSSRFQGISCAPLANLGSFDLAGDPKSSKRLLAELKRTLPFPLFRWLRKRREKKLLFLIRALSGTKSPVVKSVLADIARRYPDSSFGQAAASPVGLVEPPAPVASGAEIPAASSVVAEARQLAPLVEAQLSSFDLPALLQRLARRETTGVLELLGPSDELRGRLRLDQGNLCSCSAGQLQGADALFLLMEKPVSGRFRLVRIEQSGYGVEAPRLPLLASLMEGMRRHDEYRQACLIVPDNAVLLAAPGHPTAPEEETDLTLLKPLWEKAISGKTPVECEGEFMTDPYRVRRVLSHWVSEGALRTPA